MSPKRLLIIVLVLAASYSLYWGVGAWTTKRALVDWMEARRADGWQAEWSDITLRGFPNRFDRTIHDPVLADPATGWAWEAPWFQVLGLSYARTQLILVWPPEQRILTPHQKITLTGDEMRASLNLTGADALDRAALVFRDVALHSDADWHLTASEARLALRPTAGRAGWVDIGIEALGLAPPLRAVSALSRADLAPQQMERVTADIALALSGPLDRAALEQGRPQPTALEIREIRAIWGELDLAIAGDLTVAPGGLPTGKVQIKARNWSEMLAVAERTGLLPPALSGPLEQGLEMISGLAGHPETLDIPLTFRSGRTWLGPLPLGPAPHIRLP